MRNIGIVVGVKKDRAEIMLGMHAECKHCGACLASLEEKQRTLLAANDIGAGVGQRVEIEIAPVYAVAAAFLLFILPLLAALAGGFAGVRIARSLDLPVVLGGVTLGAAVCALSFFALRCFEHRASGSRVPRIVKVLPLD